MEPSDALWTLLLQLQSPAKIRAGLDNSDSPDAKLSGATGLAGPAGHGHKSKDKKQLREWTPAAM